jgi:hypothetical protein
MGIIITTTTIIITAGRRNRRPAQRSFNLAWGQENPWDHSQASRSSNSPA